MISFSLGLGLFFGGFFFPSSVFFQRELRAARQPRRANLLLCDFVKELRVCSEAEDIGLLKYVCDKMGGCMMNFFSFKKFVFLVGGSLAELLRVGRSRTGQNRTGPDPSMLVFYEPTW